MLWNDFFFEGLILWCWLLWLGLGDECVGGFCRLCLCYGRCGVEGCGDGSDDEWSVNMEQCGEKGGRFVGIYVEVGGQGDGVWCSIFDVFGVLG